ncbi:MAG: hypothetical protein AVDCRST_MAG60-131, partial [uncultured Nocardioides sp.]
DRCSPAETRWPVVGASSHTGRHARADHRPVARRGRPSAGRAQAAAGADPLPHPRLPLAGARAGRELVRQRGVDRRAGVGGHPARWRAAPAVDRDDGQRDRRPHPGSGGGRGRGPGAAEDHPADGGAGRAGRDGADRLPVGGRPRRGVDPGVGH